VVAQPGFWLLKFSGARLVKFCLDLNAGGTNGILHFIQPSDRNPIEMLSLETAIEAENTVRLKSAFADQPDLNDQGRPAFE
jgi:hypothetical protein